MISFTSQEAAPSFDNPLEMLRACDGKILRQCYTLRKLAPHLTQWLRSAGSTSCTRHPAPLRYSRHNAVEENELLPLATQLLDSQQRMNIGTASKKAG